MTRRTARETKVLLALAVLGLALLVALIVRTSDGRREAPITPAVLHAAERRAQADELGYDLRCYTWQAPRQVRCDGPNGSVIGIVDAAGNWHPEQAP